MSSNDKNCAVWTADSVVTLLRLYESKLGLLTTPKRKTRIWIAISEKLKDYDIEVSPDQVRWKINALTKRYKQCIDTGQQSKFKSFTELNNIYAPYNINCFAVSELIHRKNNMQEGLNSLSENVVQPESKAIIDLRKHRLADKIESDRCQSKVQLENQWLEYLIGQEEQVLLKDELFEKKLRLRQEELELRKKEIEMKESLELRRFQLKEKEQEQMIILEREKCETLKALFLFRS